MPKESVEFENQPSLTFGETEAQALYTWLDNGLWTGWHDEWDDRESWQCNRRGVAIKPNDKDFPELRVRQADIRGRQNYYHQNGESISLSINGVWGKSFSLPELRIQSGTGAHVTDPILGLPQSILNYLSKLPEIVIENPNETPSEKLQRTIQIVEAVVKLYEKLDTQVEPSV